MKESYLERVKEQENKEKGERFVRLNMAPCGIALPEHALIITVATVSLLHKFSPSDYPPS